MKGRYASAHEAEAMENPKHTAAQSVKSEHRLVFGGLGTGLNMTKTYWVVKTLRHSLFLLHHGARIENLNNSSSTKTPPFFFQGSDLTVCFKWMSARRTIPNLLNSINGAKMDHWLQVT